MADLLVRGQRSVGESLGAHHRAMSVGSFHQLSTKHLPAYLDEISFRFNDPGERYLLRDTVPQPCVM
jgi:hypothetical protein